MALARPSRGARDGGNGSVVLILASEMDESYGVGAMDPL
jgi:hypothetical protein